MKNVMIVLGVALIFCSLLVGCKEKNEEEEIGELLGKLNEAKTEAEAKRINKKIEELTERQRRREKESIKEAKAKIGKPIIYEQWYGTGSGSELNTRFSVTFDQVFVSKRVPWDAMLREKEEEKYLIVYARVENLGPKRARPSFYGRPEVKTDNGFLYDAYASLYKKIGYSTPRFTMWKQDAESAKGGWDSFGGLDLLQPREKVWWTIFSIIPKEATPVEFFGEFGQAEHMVKFRLNLNMKK